MYATYLFITDVVLSSHFTDSRFIHAKQLTKVMIFLFYYVLKDFDSYEHGRGRRQANLVNTTRKDTATVEVMSKINKLLTEGRLQLCQSKGDICQSGPPGPSVHLVREERRETEDEKGREEHTETKEIEVLWDHQVRAASRASWEP